MKYAKQLMFVGLLFFPLSFTACAVEESVSIKKIACVGDSITYGDRVKNREENCFPSQLGKLLGSGYEVGNFGLGGHRVHKGVRASYNKPVNIKRIVDWQPDVIVIMLGTNDACQDRKQWDGRENFVRDYIDLVGQFKQIKDTPTIYLCLPVPAYPGDRGRREEVHPSILLPAIKEVAKKTDSRIIDLFTPLNNCPDLFPDKIHPNSEGHRIIAEVLYDTLTNDRTESPEELSQLCARVAATVCEPMDLSGQWAFQLGASAAEKTLSPPDAPLEIPAAFSDTIVLPGTTDTNHKGQKTTDSTHGTYTRRYRHIGRAWYRRPITVPENWKGKDIELFIERALWQTTVYVDGKQQGQCDSLATPHIYNLGSIAPGRHTLTVCVDNSMIHNIGDKGHSYSENMQTIWNGMLGKLQLRALGPVRIKAVRSRIHSVEPVTDGEWIMSIENTTDEPVECLITTDLTGPMTPESTTRKVIVKPGKHTVSCPLAKKVACWDEFTPNLYDAEITVQAGGEKTVWSGKLGFCKPGSDGTHITINERPTFLRGNLDNCHFPLTGHPPMDKAGWLRVWNIYKQFGLNHVRFHSWCPPEAAFAAADEAGIYIQAESGVWIDSWMKRRVPSKPEGASDENPKVRDFVSSEMKRIIDAYGHHPSFVMFCIGNELGSSSFKTLGELITQTRRYDGTPRLYSCSTARVLQPEIDEYFVSHKNSAGSMRGLRGPRTDWTYDKVKQGAPQTPLILHELGQWPIFPLWSEIDKYTGVVEARNLQKFKAIAEKNHIFSQDADLQAASGKFSVLLYKAEMEGALRSRTYTGFHLLGLQDYMGQGEAMIGILDMFYDLKPNTITPEQYRQFSAPVVPLARFSKYIWTSGETFTALAQVSNFSASGMNQPVGWKLTTKSGKVIGRGVFEKETAQGAVTDMGQISVKLDTAVPLGCTLELVVKGTDYKNTWPIWIYPAEPKTEADEGVLVSEFLDTKSLEALDAGKTVVLMASGSMNKANAQSNTFTPVYWSVGWFPGQRKTLGLLCDSSHPLFEGFPNEGYCDWQWRDVVNKSQAMILNDLPADYYPIVQPIDDFHRSRKLGTIFESKVGSGKLLICIYPLQERLDLSACKQLYSALLAYAGSDAFKPQTELPINWLKRNFEQSSKAQVSDKDAVQSGAAALRVCVAEKLKQAGNNRYQALLDSVEVKKSGYSYTLTGDGAWKDGNCRVLFGKTVKLKIKLPKGVQGRLHIKFNDHDNGGRTGKIVFENRHFTIGKHTDEKLSWLKFDVMREDTLDNVLQLEATVTTGPNLQIDEFVFVPAG